MQNIECKYADSLNKLWKSITVVVSPVTLYLKPMYFGLVHFTSSTCLQISNSRYSMNGQGTVDILDIVDIRDIVAIDLRSIASHRSDACMYW